MYVHGDFLLCHVEYRAKIGSVTAIRVLNYRIYE